MLMFLLFLLGILAVALPTTLFALRRASGGYQDELGYHVETPPAGTAHPTLGVGVRAKSAAPIPGTLPTDEHDEPLVPRIHSETLITTLIAQYLARATRSREDIAPAGLRRGEGPQDDLEPHANFNDDDEPPAISELSATKHFGAR